MHYTRYCKEVIILLSVLFSFVGCSKSGAPSCTDESVKKLVLEVSTGEIKKQLLFQNGVSSRGKYEDVKEQLEKPTTLPWIRNLIPVVEKQVAEMNLQLINVRFNGKNDAIKKCECGGDIAASNGKTVPINYTAQFTEEGKVYVEVSGLN